MQLDAFLLLEQTGRQDMNRQTDEQILATHQTDTNRIWGIGLALLQVTLFASTILCKAITMLLCLLSPSSFGGHYLRSNQHRNEALLSLRTLKGVGGGCTTAPK